MAKVPKGYYRGPDGNLYPWTPQMQQAAGGPTTAAAPHSHAGPSAQAPWPAPPGPPVDREPWYKQLPLWAWALIVGGVVLIGAVGALAEPDEDQQVSSSSETTEPEGTSTTEERATTSEQETTTTEAPTTTTTAAPTTTVPPETVSQSNARASAADYLAYTAFSRSGLIAQLEYEGFSNADATYGVDALGTDWNEQAALSAADYLAYTSFSRSGLIDQLVYEGFSQAEAEYGVSTTGL